jgi:hypothetical protein
MILEIKDSQLHAKNCVFEQLKTNWTVGTTENFHNKVKILKNKLGNKAIQIKIFCLTKDCMV